MLYYGNLSQEQEHIVDSELDDSYLPRSTLSSTLFSGGFAGNSSMAGAVPPIVLQLDRENKVIHMADVFLAHYENVRFLSFLSANPETFGHDLISFTPTNATNSSGTVLRSPSPLYFSNSAERHSNQSNRPVIEQEYLDGLEAVTNQGVIINDTAACSQPSVNNIHLHSIASSTDSDCSGSRTSSWRSTMHQKASSGTDSGVPRSYDQGCTRNLKTHVLNSNVESDTVSSSWLISERDVPQKLLPIPLSVPAIPPEWDPSTCALNNCDSSFGSSPLRGSEEWAPPRFQIIWTLQPQKPVAQAAEKQKYRCAGCGHLVDKRYLRSLRYCHYYGRYFCTQCHTGRKSILPASVIHNWDFTPYQVSEQAADYLKDIMNEPFFYVIQINAALFKKHRSLRDAQKFRLQLAYLSAYIKQCREAQREQQIISNVETCPPHWCEMANPQIYSIADLIGVRDKTTLSRWKDLVSSLKKHVISCMHCMGRGYVCEGCWKRNDIIFPFDVDTVVVCPACRSCFHRQCHPNPEITERCPRCKRLEQRRQQQAALQKTADEGAPEKFEQRHKPPLLKKV